MPLDSVDSLDDVEQREPVRDVVDTDELCVWNETTASWR